MSRAWFQQKERGSPLLVKGILWVAMHLGRRTSRLLLYPITFYFLIAAPIQRRASQDFLSHVFQKRVSLGKSARHIFCFASTLLDRVFLLSGRSSCLDITVHGLDVLQKQLDGKRGALLLGSHLGSFEVMRAAALAEKKMKLKVLMYKDQNAFITGLLNSLNPEAEKTVIPLGGVNSLLKVNESLRNGEMVGILGDRVAENDKVVNCRFLNKEAKFPAGPILLAATLHAPVILIFGLYKGGNRYDIHFELFAQELVVDKKNSESEIQAWVQRYVDRLEHFTREAPYNWFNFYDFWART